ncbi:hypothetical protein ABZP36_030092 [Zizania latifolia]
MAGNFRDPGAGSADAPPPTPSSASQPLAQYLSLDPLAWIDPKHSRHADLRRALQADDQPQELRRIRATVADSSAKARAKVRSMQEAMQKLDRYKNMLSRKRQRCEPGAISSAALRIGAQNSSVVMNKRVRSSLADGRLEGRSNVPTRKGPLVNNEKSSPAEKEKICTRTSGTAPGLSEDKLQGLSTGGEGWEKKLKRKRSVGTMLSRGSDADRDVKPVGQHRLANEARSRSYDALSHRHGASAIAFAGSRTDVSSQQNSNASRIVSKADVDYATLPNERRERHVGIEKERAIVKGNKVHTSEDMQTGSISPLPKAKACRAPRTSLHAMGSASSFQRSTGGSDECEEIPYSNKASPLGGVTNRRHSTHSNASSPPIAWVGQRPQKISRTRRANVVSPVSNFDEVLSEGSPLDTATAARPASIESSSVMLTKNGTSSNTQTATKMNSISSPAGLSESEGSAGTESKVKEKAANSGEVENECSNADHNSAGLIFPSDKNMIPLKELKDGGVRRQGRSGRGTMHVKGYSSISKEKLDAGETRKPLKGGRPGPEKNESKVGRPPMKKGSDRKSSSCFPHALNCELEDDREELLAAANAAHSAIVGAYCGPFWKKMEPMLTFISSENLSFLNNQITIVEELDMNMSCVPDGEYLIASTNYSRQQTMEDLSSQELVPTNSSLLPEQSETNGVELKGPGDCFSRSKENQHAPQKIEADKWFHEMAPMAQRLLSALIMEDDFLEPNVVQRNILVEFSNSHNPCNANRHLANELQASAVSSNFGLSVDFTNSNNTSVVHQSLRNGFTTSSSFISSSSQNSVHTENLTDGVNFSLHTERGPFRNLRPQISSQCKNPGKNFSSSAHEYQYEQMSVNDKIFVELQSIGIFPETVPKLDDGVDETINEMISELRKRLYNQMKQKKCRLNKLNKSIQDTQSIEKRSLEQHAMNKLVERAYRKLKGGRVGSSQKPGVNKAAKQLALAFAKRTLARCQKFEETKKSCFSEASLWSVLSAALQSSGTKSTEGVERLKQQKIDRRQLDQGGTKWKKSHREKEHSRDAYGKGSGTKSGRHSSGSGRSCERKNKTKPKQKIVQLSTSGNVLGRVVEPVPTPLIQDPHQPAVPSGAKITQQPRNPPENATSRLTEAPLTNLPLYDLFDGPEGLDVPANDINFWFADGLEEPQDCDFSGALEVPDDDLTELGIM